MEAVFEQQAIVELLVGASAKLDVLWQIFIAMHFGIFTLLLVTKTELRRLGQLVALTGYLGMLGLNYGSLSATYRNLDGLHEQFRKDLGTRASNFVPQLRSSFLEADFSARQILLYGTHGSGFLLVTCIIFGRRWIVNEEHQKKPMTHSVF